MNILCFPKSETVFLFPLCSGERLSLRLFLYVSMPSLWWICTKENAGKRFYYEIIQNFFHRANSNFSSTLRIEYQNPYEQELIIDIGGNTASPSLENKLRIHLQLNECQNCLEQALALTVNLSCDYDVNKIHLTRTYGKLLFLVLQGVIIIFSSCNRFWHNIPTCCSRKYY